ncbi:unnamed protein product [Lampetra fluviatilis]
MPPLLINLQHALLPAAIRAHSQGRVPPSDHRSKAQDALKRRKNAVPSPPATPKLQMGGRRPYRGSAPADTAGGDFKNAGKISHSGDKMAATPSEVSAQVRRRKWSRPPAVPMLQHLRQASQIPALVQRRKSGRPPAIALETLHFPEHLT